jgi:flagellar biosynthetic protein FlhB
VAAAGDKTEKPTPKRRQKAREEGQVARSADVNSTAVLLATLAVLAITAPSLLAKCEAIMAGGLARSGDPALTSSSGTRSLLGWAMSSFASAAAPVLLAAAAAGILASVAQVGLRFSAKSLKPSFHKVNLAKGLKRMFAPSQAVELAKSLAKMAAVGVVAATAIWSRLGTMGTLVGMPPGELLVELSKLVLSIAIRVGAAMAVIAVLDYAWQRHKHEKTLKMTKEEVRKEAKESDVAPEVKGQIRRRQSEAARRRMLADVPSADVVVVNPTHFAVALRYDGTTPAPELVAKGLDHIAAAIRAAAEEHGVPIVSDPPLARTIYRQVEIGSMIPEELFAGVAEVLAYVYRIAGRRKRPRRPGRRAIARA